MRPRVILHMMSSIDGRITPEGWPASGDRGEVYEAVHRALAEDEAALAETVEPAFWAELKAKRLIDPATPLP